MGRLIANVASLTRRANAGTKKRLILLLALATSAGAVGSSALPVHAAPKTTVNVAYVYDEPFNSYFFCSAENPALQGVSDPRGPGCGASIFVNALTGTPLTSPGAYTTADLSKTATFTNVTVATVDAAGVAAFAPFDTVVLYQVCDIASHPKTMSALNAFATNGGKLLIYDGDRCATGVPNGGSPDYSTFIFPFTTTNPGPRGAEGCYTNVVASTLTAGVPPNYCDSPTGNDSVGDANKFTTLVAPWCASITGTTKLGNGIIQATAETPNGGLIIYEGEDNWFTFHPDPHQRQIFDLELKQDWAPSGLPCAIPASGISLAPPSQTHNVGDTATITATVVDISGKPQAGIPVSFYILSGPNMAAHNHNPADTGVTNASGQTSLSYTSAVTGTDTWEASFKDSLGATHTSNDVTVTWADAPITATGVKFTATEGQPFAGKVASFCDPDLKSTEAEYSANIDWGDSSSSPGTIVPTGPGTCGTGTGNTFDVTGSHTYKEEATYTVVVTITDLDNATNTATAKSTALVGDAAIHAACAAPPFSPQNFSDKTATFMDDNSFATSADFTASINWGDGSANSSGTVSGGPGPGPYTVSGSHTYGSTGIFTITTTINDDGGASDVAKCEVAVFAFATSNGATFVIGDLEALPFSLPGRSEYFWGSQWDQMNPMTGPSPSPSQMKGFAGFEDNLLGLPPACGGTWRTDPGNSSGPPATVPSIIAVIVTSNITQNGSDLDGNIVHIAIIKVNPGYGPNPGSPGTGTYLGNFC